MSEDPALRALRDLLEQEGFAPVAGLERRPSPYRTSFPIEELELELVGGETRRLIGKRLDWGGLGPGARLAKPKFLHDPAREPAVYRAVLPQGPSGPPRFFGSVQTSGERWLFVERVEGRELFQVGERGLWEEAARWLARFHVSLAPEVERARHEAHLLDHDARFYRRWVDRGCEFAAGRGDQEKVEWLAARHEQVVEALLALPRTVVHGEFYASNVLVAGNLGRASAGEGLEARVAPVDWELAAIGPGLADLAALVSGWPEEDRRAIAAAYAAEPGLPAFEQRDLDFARLGVAVQWLGWAPPQWEPPQGQRHDWLGEAIALAEGLGL